MLWGPEDPVAVSNIARQLADEIPDATLRWLDGFGHYPQLEAPRQTAGALTDWVDSDS